MRYRGNRKRITLLSLKKTICGANVTSRADLASAVQIRQARAAAVSAVWAGVGFGRAADQQTASWAWDSAAQAHRSRIVVPRIQTGQPLPFLMLGAQRYRAAE